ncbi:hypothetical protein KZX45_11415 [Georgenia sp. EYE_87]|uniref:hypothetical protein n=1 Tax=Georgenia sp. EYE_87 TaxID=2853448 RepID=UPI0020057FC1|nr:hypothetical protein [Georgenia sp. EYE_87]MCK6211152.1 hypothetical protein [Georgenia sp. EYE_87]
MSEPLEPNLRPASADGIPAADPGPGAPPTAPGFGVEGEEPDAVEPGAVEPGDGESSLEREPDA